MNIIKKLFHKNSNTKHMKILFKTNRRGGGRSTLKGNKIRVGRSQIAISPDIIDKNDITYDWYGALGRDSDFNL